MPSSDNIEKLKSLALDLPDEPGVYQFFDSSGQLIYVGKAKSLKKRVSSYFTNNISGKTLIMRNRINSISEIVVESESEALLLENTLIKKHQPFYNVLMKDDKTYPWICVKNEPFSRVFMTRSVIKDGSQYFGPYTSVLMVKTLLGLIRQLYQLRSCKLNLSQEKIKEKVHKVCLEYHIGNCAAPCIGLQSSTDYNLSISQLTAILRGNIYTVKKHLKKLMVKYSAAMKYEEANIVKEKLEILEKYRSRSTVVSSRISDTDVFAYIEDDNMLFVNYIRIIKGAVIQAQTLELKRKIDENIEGLISLAITELRQRSSSVSKEIVLPILPDIQEDGVKYIIPVKGDRLKLIELAKRNAVFHKLNIMKKDISTQKPDRKLLNIENLKRDLNLPQLPIHIECFDNSNIQGSHPVAACVVFRNGVPSKREYRHYNIKTVTGPDDFASMAEVVYRRYKRLIEEKTSLPQLIIIDGGKGQLSSSISSLERLSLKGKISIIGIEKRLEEIYFPNDPIPLYIDKNSYSLKIIQQLRNEAHRFGIKFHRTKRSKGMIVSELDNVFGIGTKTKELLFKKFGSLEEIKMAKHSKIKGVIGKAKANLIAEYFKKLKSSTKS